MHFFDHASGVTRRPVPRALFPRGIAAARFAPIRIFGDVRRDESAHARLKSMAGIIDCQSHLYPPALFDRLEPRGTEPLLYRRNGDRYVQVHHEQILHHNARRLFKL